VASTVCCDPDRWTGEETAVRGRAFDGDRLLDAAALHDRFSTVADLDALVDRVDGLNGTFAVVLDRGDEALAAVDHLGSTPLYYATEPPVRVGDDGTAIAAGLERDRRDPVAEGELLLSRYVLGRDTLRTTLKTLRPGEAVRVRRTDGGVSVDTRRYYRYHPGPEREPPGASAGTPIERFGTAVRAATRRLLAVADGRPVVVSLSGGVDSRLVLVALVDAGYEDVVTFSYGREWNEDVRTAERVADALDVPWEFVEYTTDEWREWFDSGERRSLYRRAFHHSRVPNYGAAPAVRRLVESGVVPRDAVFCSGQTVTGMSEKVPALREAAGDAPGVGDVVDVILDDNFSLWRHENGTFGRLLRRRLADAVAHRTVDSLAAAAAASEELEWQDHQKYNLGGARTFERHGADWWFPLWDRELMETWASVPLAERGDKRVQREYVRRRTAALADGDLADLDDHGGTGDEHGGHGGASPLDRLRRAVARSPLGSVVAPLYWRLTGDPYEHEPNAWYGIVPETLFRELYTGTQNVHSFQTLEAAGHVSFDPPVVHVPPRNGVVRVGVPERT
jgi:asparagine synthase (glutamine-hydrolysing)